MTSLTAKNFFQPLGWIRALQGMFHIRLLLNLLSPRVTLTVNLRQAVKAEDFQLISKLIGCVETKTIAATAKELSGEEATRILEHLGGFLSKDTRRLGVTIEWTRELLMCHATYISSQTRTKLKLKPILDEVNLRLSDNPELIRMRQVCNTVLANARQQMVDVSTPTSEEPLMRWSAE
jgi:hypothetical protein